MPEETPDPVPAVGDSPTALKKGARVRIQCDGYVAEVVLQKDDAGGRTLLVSGLGTVARDRLLP